MKKILVLLLISTISYMSSCSGDDPEVLSESDQFALAKLEIAYQGAFDAMLNLQEEINMGSEEGIIEMYDSLFHVHYENYSMHNENFSHESMTDHHHDSEHGMHRDSGEDNYNDGHEDNDHHEVNEHHEEDHEDMTELMAKHDTMNIH